MSLLDAIRHQLRPLLRRQAFDRDMDEEFHHHVELRAQEFAESADPLAHARATFGSQAYYMEETRRMTWLRWTDVLGQDVRYAVRNLRRGPMFTAVAVLSLAIGIGANSAVFAVFYSLLLRPLPLAHPDRLVAVQHTAPDQPNNLFAYAEYQLLKRSAGFDGLAALGGTGNVPATSGANRLYLGVDAVDGNFFRTIGAAPLRGRLITDDDESRRAPVVVISDQLWASLFNRDASAVGSTITMRGTPFIVIGILPPAYQGLNTPGTFQAAVPLSVLPLIGGDPVESSGSRVASLQVIGRLADHVTPRQAAAAIDAIHRSCCAGAEGAAAERGAAPGITLVDIARGIPTSKFDIAAMFGRLLAELMGGAAIVLLAACVNIATLLLARGLSRERDVAVRLSLGASRPRLVIQMLVESAMLATLGGAAGLLLADWTLGAVARRLPAELGPIAGRVGLHLDGRILAFTGAVSVASVLLFGVVPAWQSTRTDLVRPLKEAGHGSNGRGAGWLDRGMVVMQIVLALVLLNGAGLFVATLRNLRNVQGGFGTTHIVSANLDARGTSYERTGLIAEADRLLARAALIPGVRSAAMSATVPVYGGRQIGAAIAVEGYAPRPDESMTNWINPVTPGYFATLGIPLRRGRAFSANDQGAGTPVAIVNEAFARRYIHDRSSIGTTVLSVSGTDTILRQIIGVVGDARYMNLRQPAEPMMYVPMAQFGAIPMLGQIPKLDLTVRTASDDRAVPQALRNALLSAAPDLRVEQPATMESTIDDALSRERSTAALASIFGAVALILAAIGLYGVVSYHVARRTREIGVRMALGSAQSAVVWMVLRQALLLVTIGVALGAPLALAGGKAVGAELFGLAGENHLFVLGAGVLLIGVGVVASALPARRAARVDPLIALRAE